MKCPKHRFLSVRSVRRIAVEYHYLRNWLYVNRVWGPDRAKEHVPAYAEEVVKRYDKGGAITERLKKGRPVF